MVSVVQLHPQSSAAALEPLALGLAPAERALVGRALEFAEPLYAGQVLSTGEPAWTHALGLAGNLAAVTVVPSVIDAEVDVYAPCALGGTLTSESVAALRAPVVCGAANNQLLTHDVADLMHARGVLWVPDYVANAGGVVQVGGELYGHSHDEVEARIEAIGHTTDEVLTTAEDLGISTSAAADAVVEARLAARRAELGR